MHPEKILFDTTADSSGGDFYHFAGGSGAGRSFPPLALEGDFTICLRARCALAEGSSGDLLAQFEPKTRTGFTLGVSSLEASCTSRVGVRKLSFGLDAGSDPVWIDAGHPGGNTVLPFGFCEYQGALYVAACTGDQDGRGRVYRYEGGQAWRDCGCPCSSNAVTALASDGTVLYAASSTYDTSGTRLAQAGNMERDGHVYAFDGTEWQDCGKVADCQLIGGMTIVGGSLFVSAFDMFTEAYEVPGTGLYRMIRPGQWEFCGHPGERISPLTARAGKVMAGGYNQGGIFVYDPDGKTWESWGRPPGGDTTQIYSFVEFGGELLAGTWKKAKVFAVEGPHRFRDLGLLGNELEVMGMAVYNGKLYAGTLPLAQVYRYEGGTDWQLIDRLDHTDTEYRRAWSMGTHAGRLFCGVVPSGRIYALTAGQVTTLDGELPGGWCSIVAVREGAELSLYLDGERRSASREIRAWERNTSLVLTNDTPLLVGTGPGGTWKGEISDVQVLAYALTPAEIAEVAFRHARRNAETR